NAVFLLACVGAHLARPEYDVVRVPLSVYAVGRNGLWMTAAFACAAFSFAALGFGLRLALPRGRVGRWLLGVAALSLLGVALVQTDTVSDAFSTQELVHITAAALTFGCFAFAALLIAHGMSQNPTWHVTSRLALIIGMANALSVIAFYVVFLGDD